MLDRRDPTPDLAETENDQVRIAVCEEVPRVHQNDDACLGLQTEFICNYAGPRSSCRTAALRLYERSVK